MIEKIETDAVNYKDDTVELSFKYKDDVISITVDGKAVCCLDFENNFKPLINRMLKIW